MSSGSCSRAFQAWWLREGKVSPTPPTFSHLVLIFKPFFFLFKPPGFSHLVKQQGQLGLFEHAYSDKNKVYSEILNTQEKLSMQLQNMIQPTAKKKKQQKIFIHLFYLFFINLLLYCILCIFSLSFGATCFHSRPTGFLCLRTETLVPLLPSFAQII